MTETDDLANKIIVVVFVLWVFGHVLAMIDHTYRLPDSLNLAASTVLAFLIGGKGVKKARNKDAASNKTDEKDDR